jgi:hypothetical protein
MPLDATRIESVTTTWDKDIEYFCACCGSLVTRGSLEMAMNGDHEHVFFNPAGLVFRVLCFRDAPGAAHQGAASGVFSWFRGYLWRIAVCRVCEAHLGWRYEGGAEPRIFFGLIKSALTTARP